MGKKNVETEADHKAWEEALLWNQELFSCKFLIVSKKGIANVVGICWWIWISNCYILPRALKQGRNSSSVATAVFTTFSSHEGNGAKSMEMEVRVCSVICACLLFCLPPAEI